MFYFVSHIAGFIQEHSHHWLKPFIATNGIRIRTDADGSALKCSLDSTSSMLWCTSEHNAETSPPVYTRVGRWIPDDFRAISDSDLAGGGCGGGGGKAGSSVASAAVLRQRSLHDGVMFKQAAYWGRMVVIGQWPIMKMQPTVLTSVSCARLRPRFVFPKATNIKIKRKLRVQINQSGLQRKKSFVKAFKIKFIFP